MYNWIYGVRKTKIPTVFSKAPLPMTTKGKANLYINVQKMIK